MTLHNPRIVPQASAVRLARWGVAGAFAASTLLLLGVGVLAIGTFELGWELLPLSTALFAAIGVIVLTSLPNGHPHARFGPANTITTLRAAMTVLLAGLLPEADRIADPAQAGLAWTLTGFAALALALDGFDGQAARRSGLASRFGARYDMEVDALLILVLSVFALASGKAGVFVLAIGLMRYLFVALLALVPSLDGELAPSLRRKVVCVVQVGVLCALLAPPLEPPLSGWLAAAALALLTASFAADILALARRRG
ncbi:CDP-alcohol phosphatidyltransferase family protein [Antarcticirhabdus aurantiaca]|uniref:CDP-alcohol phosphatidyltransferase family protein n=1 Tax=Antarcticirhabdus aurantiaca TaxID=2606717 RepID=A0ACD4NH85_9HYPH|nr:CDP-alcohol phosphatidyltransferase family protein [Antarcticirhabdus aurantiaca]WAJ26171.1 CDP-alcohol phosphatidyltransferase family protein [Jeongeuplla avenae]